MIDQEYTWGRPTVYLSPRELARLEILRGKLEGRQELEPAAAAECPATLDWSHMATCDLCRSRLP